MSEPRIYFADINDPDETGTEEPSFCDVVLASDYDRAVDELKFLFVDAAEQACAMKSERDALAAENNRLREALESAKYRIGQGRVWSGMGWTLAGLQPSGQQKAMDAIDAALSTTQEPSE